MNFDKKSICKTSLSVFATLMILTLSSSGAYAKVSCNLTPLGAGTPPATAQLSCDHGSIDYTAVAASSDDPLKVRLKDLSDVDESYIRWDFGDGTSLDGTEITSSLKNPVHKYPKTGYYISELTIKCDDCGRKLWVHNNIVIKPDSIGSSSQEDVEPDSKSTRSSHQKEFWNHFNEPEFDW